MQKTEKVTLTIGVNSGYGHENTVDLADPKVFNTFVGWAIEEATKIFEESRVYPSFVATAARVGYHPEWGCPESGESTLVLSGERNPAFCQDSTAYLNAWRMLAEQLKQRFNQTTCTLTRQEVELGYLSSK